MHGVLRHYTLEAAHVDEVIRRVAQGGVPIIKAVPGFVSYSLLDGGHGQLVTYSVYESQASADESTRKAAAWVKEHIASMVPAPPRVLEGPILLREIKESPRYGVIRRYRIDPRNLERIVDRARNGFLPLVTHLPGFATYSILDAGKGTLVTLGGFTTPAGATESTRAAATFVKEHLGTLVPDAPEVTSGLIKLVERAH
jgi:Antibiotic biosynthesis monooxygenase